MRKIRVGAWRDDSADPMQVVSGPMGRERVHHEAPPAKRLRAEMKKFIAWFEKPGDTDPLLVIVLEPVDFIARLAAAGAAAARAPQALSRSFHCQRGVARGDHAGGARVEGACAAAGG